MHEVPDSLKQRLHDAGQAHVLAWWEKLSGAKHQMLAEELRELDFDLLSRLYAQRDQQAAVPSDERIKPISVTTMDADDRVAGEEALRRGEVAVLMVAGG